MQSWKLAHEQKTLGAAARAVTVTGRQYSCHGSPRSGPGLGGLGCCREEEEEFTRWQSALRLLVGTWASGVVKGPRSSFAQESYCRGGKRSWSSWKPWHSWSCLLGAWQVTDRRGTSALFNMAETVSRPCICGRKLKLMTRICLQS